MDGHYGEGSRGNGKEERGGKLRGFRGVDLGKEGGDPYAKADELNALYESGREGRYGAGGSGDPVRLKHSPWLEVWLHPKRVTRWFVYSANPLRNALPLALIAGVFNALNTASANGWGDRLGTGSLIASVLLAGLASGLLGYYVGAYLLKLVGGWLGGVGSMSDMKIVTGRIAGMTGIMVGLLWIPELLVAGRDMFTELTPTLNSSPTRSLIYLGLTGLELVLGLWTFVVLLHAIGEAHAFSAWKALLLEVILGIVLLLLVLAVLLIVILVWGQPPGLPFSP